MKNAFKNPDYIKFMKAADEFAKDYEYDRPVVSNDGSFYFYNSPVHSSFKGKAEPEIIAEASYYEQIKMYFDSRNNGGNKDE